MGHDAADDKLTERQRRFVEEYIVDPNATQAAIRAGYSERSAAQIGEQNLRKLDIKVAIARHREKRSKRLKIDADWVLHELATLAQANFLDYVELKPDGTVKPNLSKLTRDQAAAISEVVVTELPDGGRRVKFKLVDKIRTLETLGKHVDVSAFRERGSQESSFPELLTYMIERYEARLRITRDGEPLAILPPRDTPPQEIPEHPGQA